MKILHVADTHLGYAAYRRTTDEGINQREVDTYDAFTQVIDYAIATKPDLVLHAGDLFDSVRPTNRAITTALQQIIRLTKAKIPLVIISGNHETPRLRETGNIFTIFDHLDHVYPVYNGIYEVIPLSLNNHKLQIHAIPQCATKKEFDDNLKKVKIDTSADYNIFLTHGCVTDIQEFRMNEFNELIIPQQMLAKDFDYIALGHYHKHTKIRNNVRYAGSTECFTFSDAGEQKGFVELELKGKTKHTFIPVTTRSMIHADPIICTHLSITEIMKKINEIVESIDPKDKILRISLENIPSHVYRGLDFDQIRKRCSEAVHFEIKADVVKGGLSVPSSGSHIHALVDEFRDFLEKQQLQEKETLLQLGMNYIQKIEAREEST